MIQGEQPYRDIVEQAQNREIPAGTMGSPYFHHQKVFKVLLSGVIVTMYCSAL